MSTLFRRLVLTTLFVTVGFVGGLVLTGRMPTAQQSVAQTPDSGDAPAQPSRSGAPAAAIMPDLTGAAQAAIASVPNISSTQVVRRSNSPFADNPFFRDFFGDSPFGYRDRLEKSLGSGVVVSSDGYVLTNNHVIGDVRAEVSVTLPDKREVLARIIGVDEATDLAVLKIDARNLTALPWGDSSKLKVAEWVLAIGNPFGVLNQTVTLGIVSATGRRLATYQDFIQTDAAINRGNSGGALINSRGELVGINTAIFSETGGYQGVGFAVPSNLVKHVMNELITYGAVRRGTITGIELYPMSNRLAEEFGAPDDKGIIVSDISERLPAYLAGIRQYDIIVRFNGVTIQDAPHFMRLLSDAKIGSEVDLSVLRRGRGLTARVPIAQSEGRTRRRAKTDRPEPDPVTQSGSPRFSCGASSSLLRTPVTAGLSDCEDTPFRFDTHVQPHAPAPGDGSLWRPPILDAKRPPRQVQSVLTKRDAERAREVPWTPTEFGGCKRVRFPPGATRAAAAHEGLAFEWLERAYQDGGRRTLRFRDGVDEVVDAVVQVDVRDAGRAIERRVAVRRSRRGVTCRIRLADVGFGFDNDTRRETRARLVHEHLADEIARDIECRARVEGSREDHPERWLALTCWTS